jgi:hypothetical protein
VNVETILLNTQIIIMHYYQVKFNVYPPNTPPQEKEERLQLPDHHDDQEMKLYLSVRHGAPVSIIHSTILEEEQYLKHDH